MKITAYTAVTNPGWTVRAFEIETDIKATPEDFSVGVNEHGTFREDAAKVTAVTVIPGGLRLEVEPVLFRGIRVTGKGGASSLSFGYDDVAEKKTEWADEFEAKNENGILYRLYSPKADGPRPLVLFLHGGGESGSDNWTQMVGTIGAARIAEDYPDVFVLAPQAPGGGIPMSGGRVQMPRDFASSNTKGDFGWHRKYLANVCDIIRGMIEDGFVDENRVYVTGMSMGGGGTLRALSVGSGLFAAAVPICPTMTPETFGILCGLTETKLWICTAYVDHTVYRHKYIVDGILKLRDAGNMDAKLTLYSPEDLAKYNIATDPDMPLERKFGANHASWILVYNNEENVMDWLMSQTKH